MWQNIPKYIVKHGRYQRNPVYRSPFPPPYPTVPATLRAKVDEMAAALQQRKKNTREQKQNE